MSEVPVCRLLVYEQTAAMLSPGAPPPPQKLKTRYFGNLFKQFASNRPSYFDEKRIRQLIRKGFRVAPMFFLKLGINPRAKSLRSSFTGLYSV